MYTKEYFTNIKMSSFNSSIPEELQEIMSEIDKILFKDQANDWRNKPKPNFLKKNNDDEIEVFKHDLNGCLNKLSLGNFEHLYPKISELMEKYDNWEYFIEQLFNKSIIQPIFCPIYVKLLKKTNNTDMIMELLESKIKSYEEILSNTQIRDNSELNYDEFCQNNKNKIIKGGYSQFIGELYMFDLCKYKRILTNINLFVKNIENNDDTIEDNIICLDKLSRTITSAMNIHDKDRLKKSINSIIKTNVSISKRLKFKLMDLLDIIKI